MMSEQNHNSSATAAQDEDFKPKKRGLGRGLNALFEDEEEGHSPASPTQEAGEKSTGRGRQMLGIDQIEPMLGQPRRYFAEETLEELADSIRTYGVLQPLLVRPPKAGSNLHYIIAGERRWRAAQKAQLHELPVIILDVADEEAFKIAMIENLQREDLNAVDEADGYQTLIDNFGLTQEQLAESMGKSRSHITNMLRLKKLPESVAGHLRVNELSAGHARALLSAKNPGALAERVIKEGLSVRQTEKLAAEDSANLQKPRKDMAAKKKSASGHDERDINIIHLEQSLMAETGLHVYIDTKHTGKSGKVEIAFQSLDQLDEILKYLRRGASVAGAPAARDEDSQPQRLSARLMD